MFYISQTKDLTVNTSVYFSEHLLDLGFKDFLFSNGSLLLNLNKRKALSQILNSFLNMFNFSISYENSYNEMLKQRTHSLCANVKFDRIINSIIDIQEQIYVYELELWCIIKEHTEKIIDIYFNYIKEKARKENLEAQMILEKDILESYNQMFTKGHISAIELTRKQVDVIDLEQQIILIQTKIDSLIAELKKYHINIDQLNKIILMQIEFKKELNWVMYHSKVNMVEYLYIKNPDSLKEMKKNYISLRPLDANILLKFPLVSSAPLKQEEEQERKESLTNMAFNKDILDNMKNFTFELDVSLNIKNIVEFFTNKKFFLKILDFYKQLEIHTLNKTILQIQFKKDKVKNYKEQKEKHQTTIMQKVDFLFKNGQIDKNQVNQTNIQYLKILCELIIAEIELKQAYAQKYNFETILAILHHIINTNII